MTEINSLQNPRVKAVMRLRDGRHRQKQGRFLIDGLREFERAWQGRRIKIVEVFYCRQLCSDEQRQRLEAIFQRPNGAELITVTPAVFAKIAFGERSEGVLAVAETPRWKLADLELPQSSIVAVIEGIEKPGNIGAVVRSADAAGIAAVILADCRTDLMNPNAIRASLGTILTLPICQATTEETLAWLRSRKMPIFAARVDGSVPYTDVAYRQGGAIVLGSEAEGLSDAWNGDDVRAVRLPMCGVADSLNISATAAVLFFEALRQRGSA